MFVSKTKFEKSNEEYLFYLQKEIAKAYKTLTDEEAKENWKKYGNPDGPGGSNHQITIVVQIISSIFQ